MAGNREWNGQQQTDAESRRKKIPKTNKNFLEGNPQANVPAQNAQQQQNAMRQLQFMKNNFI